jgi:N-acetylmuramoyl-L-alanine amidase
LIVTGSTATSTKTGIPPRIRNLCAAFLAAVMVLCGLACPHLAAAADLTAKAARIAGDDARTRIVIDFDQKPDFSIHYLQGPDRIVIDLNGDTEFAFPPNELEARGLFSRIRFGAMSAGKARIVLTAIRPVGLDVAEARPNEDGNGWRLVLDAAMVPMEKYASLVEQTRWQALKAVEKPVAPSLSSNVANGVFLVAVDAGHGGIDTGAIAKGGTVYEKTITLAFAKAIADQLNERPGIKAFLTRDKDVFLSLGERVEIARQRGANLFISVHADTLRQKSIRGATVYTISDKASDKLAGELAQRENTSDETAGVEPAKEPSEVNDILIDLTRRETQAFSISLANDVVKSFKGQIDLINNPHRSAGFRVLTAPDVPSILMELGFLSNKEDEKLLTSSEFRDKIAVLVSNAVESYRKKTGG